jgi:hypothetical protein
LGVAAASREDEGGHQATPSHPFDLPFFLKEKKYIYLFF